MSPYPGYDYHGLGRRRTIWVVRILVGFLIFDFLLWTLLVVVPFFWPFLAYHLSILEANLTHWSTIGQSLYWYLTKNLWSYCDLKIADEEPSMICDMFGSPYIASLFRTVRHSCLNRGDALGAPHLCDETKTTFYMQLTAAILYGTGLLLFLIGWPFSIRFCNSVGSSSEDKRNLLYAYDRFGLITTLFLIPTLILIDNSQSRVIAVIDPFASVE
eukprot:Gregarina_sp_Poly_1__8909@NODE_538_length_7624_cov_89_908694_g425_i0_p3_GENE_NODE_538_length_7624_cov_89_908694_g425_i0NODE_538_length_7624_cov_89_908694_g425_i0_p3_ORF_typecomplete_len215_score9_11_NODE_538_length_7624_cov_89_908694_g425_i0253897